MWEPTTEQLLDLDGVRRRADSFRYEVRSAEGDVLGELHPDVARPPTVVNDTTRNNPRTLTGLHLPASELTEINTLTDRVKVWMRLQNGAEFSLGVFMWADDSRPRRAWGSERSSTLVDESFILDQPAAVSLGWPAGTPITQAAQAVAGALFPAHRIVIEPSAQGLATPIAHPPGTRRLTLLRDLMAMLGYLPPYFDRDAQLVMRRAPAPDAITPGLVYELGGRIIANSIVDTDNLLDAYNRFVVYEASGQGVGVVGRYDIPASAPHSVANRGFPVTLVESAQGLESKFQADWAAIALMVREGATYRWVAWDSTADPRHDTWDVVRVLGTNYVETGWSIVCRSGGRMTHVARQVY